MSDFYYVLNTYIKTNKDKDFAFKVENTLKIRLTVISPVTTSIDWGDGEITNCINVLNVEHDYDNEGNYTISFLDYREGAFKFTGLTELTEILKPLPPMEISDYNMGFAGCVNLKLIPYGLFAYNLQMTDLESLFESCLSLTFIPPGIFRGLNNLGNVKRTFAESGIYTVDNDIFEDALNLTDLYETFADCLNFTEIPSRLLYNNINLEALTGTFSGCSSIKLAPSMFISLPVLLGQRQNNTISGIKSFERTFENCVNLEAVGGDIFGVSDSQIRNSIYSYNSMFKGCINLRAFQFMVGNKIFAHLGSVNTNFGSMFENCGSLKGSAPELLWNAVGANGGKCFSGCNSLSNYADIPSNWK